MHDPLLHAAKVYAPWGLVLRMQDPAGVQFDRLLVAHDTEALYRLAREERDIPLLRGWSMRQGFIVRDVIELPIHSCPG